MEKHLVLTLCAPLRSKYQLLKKYQYLKKHKRPYTVARFISLLGNNNTCIDTVTHYFRTYFQWMERCIFLCMYFNMYIFGHTKLIKIPTGHDLVFLYFQRGISKVYDIVCKTEITNWLSKDIKCTKFASTLNSVYSSSSYKSSQLD